MPTNKIFVRALAAALIALALPISQAAMAQSSTNGDTIVPGMYGVGRIILAPANISAKPADSTECGIDQQGISAAIEAKAREAGMPLRESDIGATRSDIFRLTVTPEITTLKTGAISCVSWVSLEASATHTVLLPPIDEPKTVKVVYWQKGGLLITPILEHGATINLAFENLMVQLTKQWESDNPRHDSDNDGQQQAIPALDILKKH